MILIDTCSVLKLKMLNEEFDDLTEKILDNSNVFVTHEVVNEILYYYPEFEENIKKITIVPNLNTKYYRLFLENFDDADSSLLGYGKEKKIVIVTEDHEILKLSKLMSITSIQLCDFLFELNKEKKIFRLRKIRKIMKILRETKNITKRKYKKIRFGIDGRVRK
ncbi:MAG: hypothetical protein ISS48_04770 [Candidatus Aenigmarchaeota archaeon]|nr:hypothetical protein [Candidatus Aenigmarchaeota archaeon]